MNEFDVGKLAESLYRGYLGHLGSTAIIRHPYSQDVIKRLETENIGPAPVPTGRIARKDGSAHYFDLSLAARTIANESGYQVIHDRL